MRCGKWCGWKEKAIGNPATGTGEMERNMQSSMRRGSKGKQISNPVSGAAGMGPESAIRRDARRDRERTYESSSIVSSKRNEICDSTSGVAGDEKK